MAEYVTTGTCIDLNIDLMRQVRDMAHYTPHQRLGAAIKLVDEIESQLSAEEYTIIEVTEGNNE